MHLYNFFFLLLNLTNKQSHSSCDAINLYYSESFALKPDIHIIGKKRSNFETPKSRARRSAEDLELDTDWL